MALLSDAPVRHHTDKNNTYGERWSYTAELVYQCQVDTFLKVNVPYLTCQNDTIGNSGLGQHNNCMHISSDNNTCQITFSLRYECIIGQALARDHQLGEHRFYSFVLCMELHDWQCTWRMNIIKC